MIKKSEIGKSVDILLVIWLLFVSFLYLSNFSCGATGDDSPGYIFAAYKIAETGSPIYRDELVDLFTEKGLDPNVVKPYWHYQILDDNRVAPSFPRGYSMIMAFFGALFGQIGYYLVNPVLSVLFSMAFYCLIRSLAPFGGFKSLFALIVVILVSINNFFWTMSVYQPMRDTTPLLFIALSFFILLKAIQSGKGSLFALSGLFLGFAVSIRLEMVILLLPMLLLYVYSMREKRESVSLNVLLTFTIFFLLSSSVVISDIFETKMLEYHSRYSGVKHKEGVESLLSKIIPSGLKVENFYSNRGKFSQGVGSFYVYKEMVLHEIFGSYGFPFILLGSLFLFTADRRTFLLMLSWSLVILFFYSFWVNPYPRYIVGLIPPLAVLYAALPFGIIKYLKNNKTKAICLIAILLVVVSGYTTTFTKINEVLSGNPRPPSHRSVDYEDFRTLSSLNLGSKFDVIVVSGKVVNWGFLSAHTGVRFIYLKNDESCLDYIETLLENGYNVGVWYNAYDEKEREFIKIIENNYKIEPWYQHRFHRLGKVYVFNIKDNKE